MFHYEDYQKIAEMLRYHYHEKLSFSLFGANGDITDDKGLDLTIVNIFLKSCFSSIS